MGEYGREQRNKLSRAVANSEAGSRQLKGFVNNRKSNIIQSTKDTVGKTPLNFLKNYTIQTYRHPSARNAARAVSEPLFYADVQARINNLIPWNVARYYTDFQETGEDGYIAVITEIVNSIVGKLCCWGEERAGNSDRWYSYDNGTRRTSGELHRGSTRRHLTERRGNIAITVFYIVQRGNLGSALNVELANIIDIGVHAENVDQGANIYDTTSNNLIALREYRG